MRKDISFPPVKGVKIAVTRGQDQDDDNFWKVYIINENDVDLHNIIIVSKGYGNKKGSEEQQATSILRHVITEVPAHSSALVEPIDSQVLHLFNEYWVSYYIDRQIYDKKFIFVPNSIIEDNMIYIPQLDLHGVLHS